MVLIGLPFCGQNSSLPKKDGAGLLLMQVLCNVKAVMKSNQRLQCADVNKTIPQNLNGKGKFMCFSMFKLSK